MTRVGSGIPRQRFDARRPRLPTIHNHHRVVLQVLPATLAVVDPQDEDPSGCRPHQNVPSVDLKQRLDLICGPHPLPLSDEVRHIRWHCKDHPVLSRQRPSSINNGNRNNRYPENDVCIHLMPIKPDSKTMIIEIRWIVLANTWPTWQIVSCGVNTITRPRR